MSQNWTNESVPTFAVPSATLEHFADTDKIFKTKDDAAFIRSLKTNYSSASQAPAAATRTYITGSNLAIGTGKLQIGSMFRWAFDITKTAAGVASSTFDICVGTAGTT